MNGGTERYPDDEQKAIAYNDGWLDSYIHHKFKALDHEDGLILGLVIGFIVGVMCACVFVFSTNGAACDLFVQNRKPWATPTYYIEKGNHHE